MTFNWVRDDLSEVLVASGWDEDLGDPELFVPVERGFGSDVYAITDEVVLRVARSPSAQEGHSRERALLARLAGCLPTEVPAVLWSAPSGPGLPFGAVALSWLDGQTPVSPAQAPRPSDLVDFMVALHGFPEERLAGIGVPDLAAVHHRRRADAEIAIRLARQRWAIKEADALRNWLETTLRASATRAIRPVPRHGDLWWANLRVDSGRLRGVLDWENFAIADPAEDLATQLHTGPEAFGECVDLYLARVPGDRRVGDRARLLFGLRELMGIRLCVEADDSDELESELAVLRRSAGLE